MPRPSTAWPPSARSSWARQRELADFVGLEPIHTSKLVRALRRAGLVERGRNPADTLAAQQGVTDRGPQVLTAARARVLDLEEQRLAPIGGRDSPQSIQQQRRC